MFSRISSQKNKNYQGFFEFPANNQELLVFFFFPAKNQEFPSKTRKTKKPRENQESTILSWARHLLENLGFLDSWFSRGVLGFLDFTWEFWDFQQKTKNYSGFFGFPANNQELLGFFFFFFFFLNIYIYIYFQQKTKNSQVKQGKPRKPRENQEFKILSWARHLKQQKYQHQLKTKKQNHKNIILKN